MFFTAIAVIAFSGVSMANTIELKENVTLEVTVADDDCSLCGEVAADATTSWDPNCERSAEDSQSFYVACYQLCQTLMLE